MVYLNPHFKEENLEVGKEYYIFYKNELKKEKLESIVDETIVKLNFSNGITLKVDYSSFKDIESPMDNDIYIVKKIDSFMFFCIIKKEATAWKSLSLSEFIKKIDNLTENFKSI